MRRRKRAPSARKKRASRATRSDEGGDDDDDDDDEKEQQQQELELERKQRRGASLRAAVARVTLEPSKANLPTGDEGNASDSDCLVSDLSDIDSPSGSDDPGMDGSVGGVLTTPPSVRYRLKQIMKRKQ